MSMHLLGSGEPQNQKKVPCFTGFWYIEGPWITEMELGYLSAGARFHGGVRSGFAGGPLLIPG